MHRPTSSGRTVRHGAALIAAAVAMATTPLWLAGASSADPLAAIEAKARSVRKYVDLLKSPDQAVRVAAVTEMVASKDVALADLAIETALESPDPAMRAIGLRAGFTQVRSLVAKLSPARSPEEQAVVKACGDAVQYKIEGYSMAKGTFEASGQDSSGVGQVSGSTVSITIEYGCSLAGKLQPDGTLAGIVSAPYKKGSLPMRAAFR